MTRSDRFTTMPIRVDHAPTSSSYPTSCSHCWKSNGSQPLKIKSGQLVRIRNLLTVEISVVND